MNNSAQIRITKRDALRVALVFSLLAGNFTINLHAQEQGVRFSAAIPAAALKNISNTPIFSKLEISGDPESTGATKGLPLIYIVAGLLLLPELARTLMIIYRDYKYGGVVVEIKRGKIEITYDERLPGDTVILRDPTGKTTIHKDRASFDEDKWLDLLKAAASKK